MKFKGFLITASVIAIAGGFTGAFITQSSKAAPEPEAPAVVQQKAPAVRVAMAETRQLTETLAVNGTILPREEANAGTDLGGLTVLDLRADEGDNVTKGEVLAVLDRSTLDNQLVQTQASRAQAEANIAQMQAQIGDADVGVRQAREALERATALQKKGIATKAEFDNAVNAVDSARARRLSAEKAVAAAEAQLGVIDAQIANVELQLTKTEVRAPADGLVLARSATLGGVVSAANGPLFRIAVAGELELDATVSETALPRLSAGMPARVTIAGADTAITGKIRRISPEVNQTTRLGSIRVSLDAASAARVGNFARGEIETIRREGIVVPAGALVYRARDAFLQLVEDGVVHTVPVKLGARVGSDVEIVEGIRAGQEVVARAGTFVGDGDHVEPVRGALAEAVAQ